MCRQELRSWASGKHEPWIDFSSTMWLYVLTFCPFLSLAYLIFIIIIMLEIARLALPLKSWYVDIASISSSAYIRSITAPQTAFVFLFNGVSSRLFTYLVSVHLFVSFALYLSPLCPSVCVYLSVHQFVVSWSDLVFVSGCCLIDLLALFLSFRPCVHLSTDLSSLCLSSR